MLPQLDAFWLAVLAAETIGQLWLRVLVVAVIPLAATSLALALADLDRGALGRLGARALVLAAASSAIARNCLTFTTPRPATTVVIRASMRIIRFAIRAPAA